MYFLAQLYYFEIYAHWHLKYKKVNHGQGSNGGTQQIPLITFQIVLGAQTPENYYVHTKFTNLVWKTEFWPRPLLPLMLIGWYLHNSDPNFGATESFQKITEGTIYEDLWVTAVKRKLYKFQAQILFKYVLFTYEGLKKNTFVLLF